MKRVAPWLGLGLGLALICAGIWRAEWQIVLSRAVQICLTCIGIG